MGSIYEQSAIELEKKAAALGLSCHVLGIPDRGDWCRNTEYKPFFVRDCMGRFPDKDIAYTDADSEIHRYPSLFDSPNADALVRIQDFAWRKAECLSGTFFLRNNEKCKAMVHTWINKVSAGKTVRSKPETWEQHRLGEALRESGVDWAQLPHEYVYFDHIEKAEGRVEFPVFTHKQYSRKQLK
jgi:hypothetical protein